MTYRKLVEICYNNDDCTRCQYRKECYAFDDEMLVFPFELYTALNTDLDKEIDVSESKDSPSNKNIRIK